MAASSSHPQQQPLCAGGGAGAGAPPLLPPLPAAAAAAATSTSRHNPNHHPEELLAYPPSSSSSSSPSGFHQQQHQQHHYANSVAHSVFESYFHGQLANVVKAAIWWSTFGVFAEALTQWQLAVGVTRLAFNSALILVSPIAGSATERVPIQKLLRVTTIGRCFIWCLLIPAAWYLVGVHLKLRALFACVFLLIMLIDGVLVSFANVVDVDCGGLDTFAAQLGLTASATLKERYTHLHQRVFDLSFVCLTPVIAGIVWLLAARFDRRGLAAATDLAAADLTANLTADLTASRNFDVAMLVGGICVPVGVLSFISLYCYQRSSQYAKAFTLRLFATHDGMSQQSSSLRLAAALAERMREVWDGMTAVVAERPLCWRLTFLALETALEDAVVSILFPQVAIQIVPLLYRTWFGGDLGPTGLLLLSSDMSSDNSGLTDVPLLRVPGGWTFVNFFAVLLIALGKLGGLVAGCLSISTWRQPASVNSKAYRRLMLSILISGVCLSFFPLGLLLVSEPQQIQPVLAVFKLADAPKIRALLAVLLLAIGSFLYFVFVTAPKFGLANLLQAVAAQGNIDSQVFSFVGTYVTAADALVILLLSWNFSSHSGDSRLFMRALLVTVGGYIVYGCLEVLLSPRLILRPVALRAELEEMSLTAEYPGISALSPTNDGGAEFDFAAEPSSSRNFRCAWPSADNDPLRPINAEGSWAGAAPSK